MGTRESIGREMRFRLAVKVFEVVCKSWTDQRSMLVMMKVSGRADEIALDHLRSWSAHTSSQKFYRYCQQVSVETAQ